MRAVLKKGVRRLFNAFGFELTRIWGAQRFTMAQVLASVRRVGFEPGAVIDVGVGDGTYDLYNAFPDCRFVLIEPLEERREVLEAVKRQFNAEYVIAAASDKAGTVTMNVHPHLNDSSTHKEREGSHADGVEREVPTVTADDVCQENGLVGPFLFKVDTQGHELTVMEGAKQVLAESEVVILETQLFEMLVGCPQLYDTVSYMKERGFVVYDCFGNYYRPLDGALAGMDLVFVKADGMFRKEHVFATAQQREEMKRLFVRKGAVAGR